MKPRFAALHAPVDTPDEDLDDRDLRELFSVAASASRDDFELDLEDVLTRAASLHAPEPERRARSPLARVERAFMARNGAFVSTISAFAAAACLWLSAGAGYPTPGSNQGEASQDGPGICAESESDANACMIPASMVRVSAAPKYALSSDDFRVCDARLVTCVP
jgi:hypothetical protein